MSDKLIAIIKFVCIAYLVILVPKIISFSTNSLSKRSQDRRLRTLLGVEHLAYSKQYEALKNIKLGLVGGRESVKLLRKNGFAIKTLFQDTRIQKLSDRVFSAHCAKLDAILIDIKDSGVSSDQAVSILKRLLGFSSHYNKRLIVLDRPNPLGAIIEGPGKIPWRHGLTIGEMAHYLNRNVLEKPAPLEVIPLKRWRRGRMIDSDRALEPLGCLRVAKGKLSQWETRYLKRLCWKLGLHCFECDKKDVLIQGVELRAKSDLNNLSLFNSLLTLTRFLKNRKQIKFSCSHPNLRRFIHNKVSFDRFKKEIEKSVDSFYDKSKLCCLYKPFPVVVKPELTRG